MSHPIQNDNPLCIIFFALTRQNYRCEKCCVLFIKYFFNEAITVIEILAHFSKQCSSAYQRHSSRRYFISTDRKKRVRVVTAFTMKDY